MPYTAEQVAAAIAAPRVGDVWEVASRWNSGNEKWRVGKLTTGKLAAVFLDLAQPSSRPVFPSHGPTIRLTNFVAAHG